MPAPPRFLIAMTFAAVATLVATSTAAFAQRSDDKSACLNEGNAFSPGARIAGCSALLRGQLPKKYLPYAFYDRGTAFQAEGDYARAIADYTDAIRLKPNYAHAFYNRGTAYQAEGDYDHAIADYTEAIRLKPAYFRAYRNRGLAYQAKGDNSLANTDLNEASGLNQ